MAVMIVMLLTLLAILTFAEDSTQTNMENVLTYDGLSARVKGYGGIRSVYMVDKDAVSSLEEGGYSVVYGAVMGIGNYKGQAINTTRSLAVNGDFLNGYTAANANAAAVVVYATGEPSYVNGKHLDNSNTSFAYTTTYADASAEKYGIELVYAGFVAVTDSEGNQTVLYDYAEGTLFGAENSTYGAATSALELSRYFVNDYSKSQVKAYYYNQCETLRTVLNTCGEAVRDVEEPIILTAISEAVSLQKALPQTYVTAAGSAYKMAEYADYTTSIISNYSTSGSAYNDRPLPVTLSWTALGTETLTYTVTLATDASFTKNVRTVSASETSVDVYNLLTGTTYYWKVKAVTADGFSYESSASTFETANTVRWIYVDGVRNVRDIGGWNGLNQGLVYRGSELNLVGSHGLQITDAGVNMMANVLGIKTDLDFRAADQNGAYGTSSPLGSSVTWKNCAIGNFLSAFNSSYAETMRTFIDYDNYPIYMHCWGGADRTGTVGFMLSGLCGASEEDLAIDLELTSFAIFGYRYRYDNGAYLYASTVARLKTYSGTTLQEKFETAFKEAYGFTEAQISNIQAINTQSGAVYDFAEEENGDISYNSKVDESFTFSFVMRNSTDVASVKVGGVSLDYSFDNENSCLTVFGDKLIENSVLAGIGTITFDDGATLRFYLETDLATEIADSILAGDYALLIEGSDALAANGEVTVNSDGSFEIPAAIAAALYNAGYESVSVRIPAGVTYTVYDKAGSLLSAVTVSGNGVYTVPLNNGTVVFSTENATIVLSEFSFNRVGSSWVDEVSGGDYKAFFGTGTNSISQAGDPILDVTSANFTVSTNNIAKLTALGYTHITFTVDVTFADGTTGCCLAIRHSGKRYEQLYSALTAVDGRVMATVTIALNDTTGLQLITRSCEISGDKVITTSYTAVAADSFIISGVSFSKSGTEGALDNHPAPDPNEEYVKGVNGGAYDTLLPTGTLTESANGEPIQIISSGNFIVKEANLAKAIAAGYQFITFKVKVEFADDVTEGFICVRMNGVKYETKYTAFTTTDGVIYALATLPIGADTTTLQFISRADYTVDGKVNTGSHDQVTATFTFSEISFLKNGTEGVTSVKSEPTDAERLVSGEWNLIISNESSDFIFIDGAIIKNTGVAQLNFSNAMLEELRAAGYTKVTFTMSAEADNLGRIVCRWKNSSGAWQSSINKNDLNPATNGATKTVTFDLTEATSGSGWYIAFQVQNPSTAVISNSTLTLTDFSFS